MYKLQDYVMNLKKKKLTKLENAIKTSTSYLILIRTDTVIVYVLRYSNSN